MHHHVIPVITPTKNDTLEEVTARPLPIYESNKWGDRFLQDTPPHEENSRCNLEQEMKQLKEEVRRKPLGDLKDPKEMLMLIDVIQQLGVAYHYEQEIYNHLKIFHNKNYVDDGSYEDDLQFVSLRFRLLRQQGFNTSCDVFQKFMDNNGYFKEALISDVQGILNFYEASHFRVHGEKILDEALAFTTSKLMVLATQLDPSTVDQIRNSLKLPLHKRTTRLWSRYFISIYELIPSHDGTLLRFAKLDFNFLQLIHREELRDICRWDKRLDFATKLPYARDRVVEAYFWILGVYYEPCYAFARMILNKMLKIISILDDTYDTYGTIQELELFTHAIQRWHKSCMVQLPDYMKYMYESILDTLQEIEEELAKDAMPHVVGYMKREIIGLCEANLKETGWCHKNFVPTYDEYMRNGIISCGCYCTITASFMGMGHTATKENFEWIHQNKKAILSASIIGRLINDMAGHKFEHNAGQGATAVECYMAQYGVTLENTYVELQKRVEEEWKTINQDVIEPNIIPRQLIMRAINLCRTFYDIYQFGEDGEDGYSAAVPLRTKIEALLINPIIL